MSHSSLLVEVGAESTFEDKVRFTYTKKMNRNSRPPSSFNKQAWRWNGSDKPELVLRSPADPNLWVTQNERKSISEIMSRLGYVFNSRHGLDFVLRPTLGDMGWLKRIHKCCRERVIYNGSCWIPCISIHTEDSYRPSRLEPSGPDFA